MRTIEFSGQFKRDLKREKRGQHREIFEREFWELIEDLANDRSLVVRYRDHSLTGDWRHYRDCHIRPDLVLIYRKVGDVLRLARLGSHAELGL